MKELISRWKSPTPEFWKKVQVKGAVLLGASAMAASVQTQFPAIHIPAIVTTVSTYTGVVGFTMTLLAKLTCDTPPKS